MNALEKIRENLRKKQQAGSGKSSGGGLYYPHWKIPQDSTAVIRFLPDGNPDNPYFWVEKLMIKMPFNGIKGQSGDKVTVQVPCVEMYKDGRKCPVLTEIREQKWFNDPSTEKLAHDYWKKRTSIFHGFIKDDPIGEKPDDVPENPIRRFLITSSIHNLIERSLMDTEIENIPTDYQYGLDFRITRTLNSQGYSDYGSSSWARRESALTEQQLSAIDQYGLPDLSSALPPVPDQEHLDVIYQMFEASVGGESYDPDRWGRYYAPYGMQQESSFGSGNAQARPKPQPQSYQQPSQGVEDDDIPFERKPRQQVAQAAVNPPAQPAPEPAPAQTKSGNESKDVNDILAYIRSRKG